MELFSVNPKSVHSSELFGDFDPYTRDWTDGLIALATRKFSNELQQQHGTPEEHSGRPVSTAGNMTNISDASQVCCSRTSFSSLYIKTRKKDFFFKISSLYIKTLEKKLFLDSTWNVANEKLMSLFNLEGRAIPCHE